MAGERNWAETPPVVRGIPAERSRHGPIDRLDAADRSRGYDEISLQLYFTLFLFLFLVFSELFRDISEFLIYLIAKLGL